MLLILLLFEEIRMASLPAQTFFTPEEYITQERKALHKSEYLNGQIFAMSGASRAHSLITSNISNRLYNQLMESDCEVHSSDMRVQASPAAYFYPDVVVACSEPRFADDVFDTLLNPIVIVEVLSPSTAVMTEARNLNTISNGHHYKTTSLSHRTDAALNIIGGKGNSGNIPNFEHLKMSWRAPQSDARYPCTTSIDALRLLSKTAA